MTLGHYFITGIGTDVGKTIVSSLFVRALKAAYWKPVQCGDLDHPDSLKVRTLSGSEDIIPSAYALSAPMSPHAAAARERISISLDEIASTPLPTGTIIEGAGGILVPLNGDDDVIDIARVHGAQVVLVIRYYLGCINHTLLSIEELRRRGLAVVGLVFNGEVNEESKEIILRRSRLPCLLEIGHEARFTPQIIDDYAQKLQGRLRECQSKGR